MALQADDIADLVLGIDRNLGPPDFGQIAQDMTDYPTINTLLRKDHVKFSGRGIERRLMVKQSKTAAWTGYYGDDALTTQDVLAKCHVPWRHIYGHYIFDVREVMNLNTKEEIVDYVKAKRVDMLLGLAEKLELAIWSKPLTSADEDPMYGFAYWVTPDTSFSVRGFVGGDPAGFAAGAGNLTSALNPTWQNWYGQYATYSDPDFSKELRYAWRHIKFHAPSIVPDTSIARGKMRYKIYAGEDVIEGLNTIARAQNDNIGPDIGRFGAGDVTFKRTPFEYVEAIDTLDTGSKDPVYMIDLAHTYITIMRGDNFRRTGPDTVAGKHNVKAVFVDLSINTFCTDRRRNALIRKA